MRISLIGEVTIEHAGRRVSGAALGGRQVRLALALLVLERANLVRKDQFADLLWPDQPPSTWEVAQRGIVARVRRALALAGWDPPDLLTTHNGTYRLRLPDDVIVDVEKIAYRDRATAHTEAGRGPGASRGDRGATCLAPPLAGLAGPAKTGVCSVVPRTGTSLDHSVGMGAKEQRGREEGKERRASRWEPAAGFP